MGGNAALAAESPGEEPATAAVVSASRPMFTAVSTEPRKSPRAAMNAPKARPTASGARSVHGYPPITTAERTARSTGSGEPSGPGTARRAALTARCSERAVQESSGITESAACTTASGLSLTMAAATPAATACPP